MRLLIHILLKICRFSAEFPRLVIAIFLAVSVAGFSTLPFLKISTDLISGVGETNPIITLTKEDNEIFGEADALIIVLEFPEPPGAARLPFIKGLGEAVAQLPGVRRVRYQFVDPENEEQTALLLKQFLLGMNDGEREQIRQILSAQGSKDALRRNTNRLFLIENPYLQKRILEDPLELGQFVADSMKKRIGSVSLGDTYMLIASPDSTTYLMQVTPDFPSHDIIRGEDLWNRLNQVIPERVSSLIKSVPGIGPQFKGMNWYITGKMAFQQESGAIFDRESLTIVLCSFGLVLALLLAVYQSFWSAVLLLVSLGAGIGPNYAIMYLSYDEINPVVMGATAVLLGLGTEYGEHLWGRIREEIDKGTPPQLAVFTAYEQTGPPVMLGALTGVLAFLCLCFSNQPALAQFGYLGASGLALTLTSTLFLVPALVTVASNRKKDYFPRIRVSFKTISTLFQRNPAVIVTISALVVLTGLVFAFRISYEKDLFKVFLARDMNSMDVSERISRKFHSNFSKPVHLCFDVDDLQAGLSIQRQLDGVIEGLIQRYDDIASFDSISYLMSPDSVARQNIGALSEIYASWPEFRRAFKVELENSSLSATASETMEKSFSSVGNILKSAQMVTVGETQSDFAELERSWYMARIKGKYRFLTQIRYSDKITNPEDLKKADGRILEAVKELPVQVNISGTRQAMEAILSNLVSELFRLGLYAFVSVVLIFFAIFPRPRGVALCLIPMLGALCITLGVLGATGMGLPFSIVCVAPLIFGFGIHNGAHVVMGSLFEEGGSIAKATTRVTPRAMVVSMTIIVGFVSMLTSRHYSLEFLGWSMVIGMVAAVPLTLTTLPAVLLLLEKRKN
ncbi:MAG TPA: MMPL family transporter [Desulfomonilaceae bacterium]|nr:MMPL family transporter [Desulfomonilaceae bacterium]